jgi:TolB protein
MMPTRILMLSTVAFTLAVVGFSRPDDTVRAEPLVQQVNEISTTLINKGVQDKLGLPDFIVPASDAELVASAKTVADVLWDDLDFEREYNMIERKASASIPLAPATSLPFDRWVELGADLVAVASASRNGENMAIEFRLVYAKGDKRGQNPFGTLYTCKVAQARFCAHSIADDVHKKTKGLDGVARTKLAFSSDRDSSRVAGRPSQTSGIGKEIYVSDYDGGGQQRFTVNRNLNISPTWAPGGGMLAYTSYLSGNLDIYVASFREPGRALRRPAFVSDAYSNSLPSWSPDGTKLAYSSNRSGNMDVWVVNADGTGQVNLTASSRADDTSPTWSPDGRRIAFVSTRETGSTPLLYVMNAAGGAAQNLTRERADRPTWSAQNFIAFTAGSGGSAGSFDIGFIDMSDPSLPVKLLTSGQGSNEGPTVAPNGRHIAFFTTRWGKKQIAVIDRRGGGLRQLTNSGNNDYPNWQPFAPGQQ